MRPCVIGLVLGIAVCLGCKQEPAPQPEASRVEYANESTFNEKVLASEVPVLVDFYADWCGPCRLIAPLLEELAAENPNVRVVKVNVDESRQLAARYQIRGIPSLKLFKNGNVVAQHVGLADKQRLESLLLGQ